MTDASSKMAKTVLVAPISGVIVPIAEVPDPTFSEKMVGDGVAIDPTEETLCAPCDGVVTQLPDSAHALTVRTPSGIDVLMHIGLETVSLKGKGFKALVRPGDEVRPGDRLIAFNADYIARNAASLLTMVVVPTPGTTVKALATGMAVAGKTSILQITGGEDTPAETGTVESEPIVVLNPDGIHARPAAVLVNGAKKFSADIKIAKGGREVNAKSVVGLMSLGIAGHDTVRLTASGNDARAAVDSLTALIRSGLGENLHAVPKEAPKPTQEIEAASVSKLPAENHDENLLKGTSASPGLVAGTIFQLRHTEIEVAETGGEVDIEKASLLEAVKISKGELARLENDLRMRADAGKAAIFAAHQELLDDPELISATNRMIESGKSAPFAWKQAFTEQSESLANVNNELLAARANDIRDIGRRVLSHLTGIEMGSVEAPEGSIIVAKDLTPSDTAGIDKNRVLGFCTTEGSATSHASILARSAGIPAIAAIEERALGIPDGTPAILDGERGELRLNPSGEEMAAVRVKQAEADRIRSAELSQAQEPAVTTDGHRVKVVGNISGVSEAEEIPVLGGEGVGLLRSEFLFLQRTDAPSEEEQSAVYVTIAKALGKERDLVVRTLDVGGDKPLAYLPLSPEVNPFLGVRGIRLNMLGTELFTSQVRAVLTAAPYSQLSIMFPMVSSLDEVRAAKEIVLREKTTLGIGQKVAIGIMVEVPSAAVMADVLAPEVDFFSIGTNDLTQYTLAIDRGHPKLAAMADALHPAVLRLMQRTVEGAHKFGKWVGVCGGIASDPAAAPILVGLGIDELSVSIKGIPQIKAAVRRQSLAECRRTAEAVLSMATAREVRQYLAAQSPRSEEA